jgi:hypothetical protein
VVDLVRVAEVHWICRGQWDSWKRALEHHLAAARAMEDGEEQAWALHELALSYLCCSDPVSALDNLERAKRLREQVEERGSIPLTQGNIETLIRLTTQPPGPY